MVTEIPHYFVYCYDQFLCWSANSSAHGTNQTPYETPSTFCINMFILFYLSPSVSVYTATLFKFWLH